MDFPLSRMRDFLISGREIVEQGDYLIFGDRAFHKSCQTNYLIWNKNREYYTLESVYFFLKNRSLVHTSYVKEAAAREIQVVTRPDRKSLEDYLTNEKLEKAPPSLDSSGPYCNFVLVDNLRSFLPCPSEPQPEQEPKRPRINQEELARKERLFAMLGKGSTAEQDSKLNEPIRELSKDLGLTADKIAALRSKALARKRTQIQTIEDDLEEVPTEGTEAEAPTEERVEKATELITEEIVYVTRNSVLLAPTKDILAIIQPTLREVEMQAKKNRKENNRVFKDVQGISAAKPSSQPAYSRYDQDRFKKSATEDFNIDTKRTFTMPVVQRTVTDKADGPSSVNSKPRPGKANASMPTAGNGASLVGRPSKRSSRIPIIVLPSTTSSLVTLFNARELLENLRYASSEEAKSKATRRENEILIHRRRDNGTSTPYRIVNNPLRFTNDEWSRVVAVFVQGPAWQFKGWPLGTNPPDIFTKVCAFHLKWEDDKLDTNVSKWAVNVLTLSRTKRHLDRACLHKFWETLDRFMVKNKPDLDF
uniref:Cell division control protein 73 C-terminal domain-containing protein n=1 Tax=Trichuris muris TaxID=70415 RepID=A0A5S6QYX2_TRIMR